MKRTLKTKLMKAIATATALVMSLSISAAAIPIVDAGNPAPAIAPAAEEFLSLLDYDAAMVDAQYLVEEIGVRLAGTQAELAGLAYVEDQYEELGYEIERHEFTVETKTSGDIYIGDMVLAGGTPSKNENFTGFTTAAGTSVYLDDPAKAAELGDMTGKIVFFPGNFRVASGTPVSQASFDAVQILQEKNAAGIVGMMDIRTEETERYQIRCSVPNFKNVGMTVDTPVLVINSLDAEKMMAFFAENENVAVSMDVRDHVDSESLIATKKAAVDTDLTLYVTCHIDSVLASPGANDDASGVVGVLAIARAFKDIDTNYNIKFITFGSEEIGLQGAHAYAKAMTEQEIADAIGNYNLDMVATSQENCIYIFMNSSTNPSAPVNDASLETHVTRMSREAAEALGYDLEYYRTCYDRTTDHYALHLVGIPAVEFDWRANAEGTSFEAYYHTRYDDFEHNFSKDKLKIQVDAIALAVYNDATADYVAVVGDGVYREYYESMSEALAAAEITDRVKDLTTGEYVERAANVLSQLDYDAAMVDAKYLVEEIGVRLAGTQSELAGLAYVEDQYEELGYEIERHEFTVATKTSGDIYIGDDMIVAAGTPAKNAAYTGFGEASGTSVYLADPAKASELGDLTGKIVFFPGNCRQVSATVDGVRVYSAWHQATYDAIAALEAKGAAGIVVLMDATTEETERYQIRVSTPNFVNANMTSAIPVLVTNAMDGEKLMAFFAANENVAVSMDARDHVDSQSLIATKKAAVDTDLTVYVTCHIDSVLASPGANDDASGVVGVLAMARAFENIDTNYNIKFITFGSEEIGLQGAHAYAKAMSEQEIEDAIGNYNLDMVATSQENCVYIFMNSSTNPSAPVNDESLETHVTRMSREAAEALGYDLEYYRTCYDRTTDHYALHLVGIPAVEFDWRANAEGTSFEAYYHTRYDDFEHNFSKDKLKTQVDAIALAVYNDATADYVAVVGEGVYREYYESMEEAWAAAESTDRIKDLTTGEYVDLLSSLDYDAAMVDAQYLVEEIGVRLAGTQSELAGLAYIEEQYEELGYEIERHEFTVETKTSGDIYIGDNMIVAAGTPAKNAAYTGFGEASGTSVYLADPAKASELGDLTGKIVFFPGNCRQVSATVDGVRVYSAWHQATYDAIAALEAKGAAGIVVLMDATTEETERYQIRVSTPNFVNANMTSAIPVLVTNAMDGEKLMAFFAANENVAVSMDARDHVDSQSLIATKKAAVDTDLTVYVTCHIDSVLASPGANDDASGVVGVLAIARAFKDIDTNYNIKFITFGSEEIGLQGAHAYAKAMSEQEIEDAIGNYNLDMVATSQENCVYIFMNSSTNPSAPVNDESLETHVTRMSREAAEALGYDLEYYRTCYDRTTDHYALHLVGIPAVEFDWRANAEGTSFEAYYHTRYDDFEHNFSKDKLKTQVDAIALAIFNDVTADYAAVVGEGVYREYYDSVAEAVEAVEDNGIIKLLKDSNEKITINKVIKFTLDENGYDFSGKILAGTGYKKMAVNGGYIIKKAASGSSSGSSSAPADPEDEQKFIDVADNAWYAEAVDYVTEKGLMIGVSDNEFGPEIDFTRAQLVQVLYAKAGKPAVTTNAGFTDVAADAWYADAVNWAAAEGVTAGVGDGTFAPDALVSREQLAVFLYADAGKPAAQGKVEFADSAAIADWAVQAISWAVDVEMFNVAANAALNPQTAALRCDVALALMNVAK